MLEDGKFVRRFAALMRNTDSIKFPSVTIEYRDLCVEADALVGSNAIPTVANTAMGALKTVSSTRMTTQTSTRLLHF